MAKLKKIIPWRAKMIIKIIFSKMGMVNFLLKIHIFRHGKMDKPSHAFELFKKHFFSVKKYLPKEGFTVLELGPGDSLFSAVIAQSYGAKFSYLVDVRNFAKEDISTFAEMADFLKQKGLISPETTTIKRAENLSKVFHYKYLTSGLDSLRAIPDDSVDFIFSNAVLEHIHKGEFLDTMRELRRILKIGGLCSHSVDLKDHLGYSINNLRFSEKFWEKNLIYNSSFYTNRIRFFEMLNLFLKAGFRYQILKINRFNKLPVSRSKLFGRFRSLPEEDLLISEFDVLLFPV